MSDVLKRAMESVQGGPGSSSNMGPPLQMMRDKRKHLITAKQQLLDEVTARGGAMHDSEKREMKDASKLLLDFQERVEELEDEERRANAARAAYREVGVPQTATIGYEPGVYRKDDLSVSFFRDLNNARRGDYEAMQRLHRNNQEAQVEKRALGSTGGVGGSGAEFSPPGWVVEDWIKYTRPGRVTANLFHREPMPSGVSSINLPKVTGGTTVATQSTQNTALSQTDLVTNSVTAPIVTIGGKQVVSQQLIDTSAIPFDRIILEDLAEDYSKKIGYAVVQGTGVSNTLNGCINVSSTNKLTWTQASPTAPLFYSQLAKLQSDINSSRFAPPDAVVMHPRRWGWLASYTDSTGRPLVVPTAGGFNSLANPSPGGAAGHVGSLLGMAVYTDPNIPITENSDQDVALMLVTDDIWMYESQLFAATFDAPYSDSLSVLYRIHAYSALAFRYEESVGMLTGTGMAPPVFAG